jgi:hypothetical protein
MLGMTPHIPKLLAATMACLTALLALAGCGSDIDANDYDRSCTLDEDCMVIFVGDTCGCSCDTSAINVSDRDAYLDDSDPGPTCDIQCGACAAAEAVCAQGVCKSVPSL